MRSFYGKLFIILILSSTSLFAQLKFDISYSKNLSDSSFDGRVLLMISNNNSSEPRFQITDYHDTQMAFGINVENYKAGDIAQIDKNVFGYPIKSISKIPAGEYYVQAMVIKYETFHRSDGHVVKLPPDRGEGQQWNKKPGNFLSEVQKVYIDPAKNENIKIEMTKEIPPIEPAKDTKYIKHIKMKSEMLSKFWGRPVYLGAVVLLPEGFDEHPEARYPLVIFHGHYPHTFGGFTTSKPDTANMKSVYSSRFDWEGYNKTMAMGSYQLYKDWTGPDFPRMVVVQIQHANPYYDDSYAVNSENLGPYGDAITYELIPYIEKKFRGIGKGWARFLYGGSTGGWEALAVQVKYPDEYNGCWAACPDPIDFRKYTIVNIYENKNAYFLDSDWRKTPRPAMRDYMGEVKATLEQVNHRELVIGDQGRSGQQWDIWQAVYSPVGGDGYPKPIWNKMTGEIDKSVAEYWKENYDLRYILQRDWKTLGPKLKGKIHIYCGDMDTYYLNDAVYLMEDFLESTKDPYYEGEVDYGDRAEHCWNGDHSLPNALSRLRYQQIFIPRILNRIKASAPEDADLTSWRY